MPPLTRHRVLVTGFGPFRNFKINPSWLAAQQLHSNVLFTNDPKPESIEITSILIPTVYQDVLDMVPGLHASPPVLPGEFADRASDQKYSLIVHIGVAGPGPLRFEQVGHKTGYNKTDHENKLADIRVDASCDPPLRGFAASKYAALPEELTTRVDAVSIVDKLAKEGVQIRTSVDAGHYLCDFIYYCSLAESKLAGKETPVIFIHCPPIGEPLTTEQVAAGVREIIVSACSAMR